MTVIKLMFLVLLHTAVGSCMNDGVDSVLHAHMLYYNSWLDVVIRQFIFVITGPPTHSVGGTDL